MFVGFNLTFGPQFILGYLGMPRRYHVYPEEYQVLNVLSSAGASILAVGYVLIAIYLVARSSTVRRPATNPWHATGLEWTTQSPPLPHNFETQPVVTEDAYEYSQAGDQSCLTHIAAHADHGRTGTHAHHPALQHHFDSLEQQHEAATLGMWLFLITEVLFFGGLFLAYMLYRVWYPEAWAEGSHRAGHRPRRDQHRRADRQQLDDGAGGSRRADRLEAGDGRLAHSDDGARSGLPDHQVLRVHGEVRAPPRARHRTSRFRGPHAAQVQIYFSLYFLMTGLHAHAHAHRLRVAERHRVDGAQGPVLARVVHAGRDVSGLYWHFVDIVWIFLFPLLYLVDRAHARSQEPHVRTHLTQEHLLRDLRRADGADRRHGRRGVRSISVRLNFPVAIGIAITKATLVILFFMHAKYSSKLTKLFVGVVLLLPGVLFGLTFTDYLSRGWLTSPRGTTMAGTR